MATFKVVRVIDGDTFEVSPEWKWKEQTGTHVRPTGYNAPELHEFGGQQTKQKLERLILGKNVELGSAYRIDRGRLVCDVYFGTKNLADYFQEYH